MSGLTKAYLLAYNGAMFAGWTTILVKIILHYVAGGSVESVYPLIADNLYIFQTGALLEVLHSGIGIVRSPVVTTFLQVMSRIIVLYGSLRVGATEPITNYFCSQMVVAWSLSEIVRYSFYFLNLLDVKPQALTWLRYSAFSVLYPIGITGEIACMYLAMPYIGEHKPYTMEMPNSINFSFSFYNFVVFLLAIVYPFGSYVMYSYMLAQRKKVLGGAGKGAASNGAASASKSSKKAN